MGNKHRFLKAALSTAMAVALASSLMVGAAFADSAYTAGTPGSEPGVALQSGGKPLVEASKKNGWNAQHTSYYRDGAKVTGLQKIGKHRYYFTAEGVLKTKDVKVGDVRYFVNAKGALIGAKIGEKYYYKTLKRMTKADAFDFQTFLKARSIIRKITDEGDSKATKRWKAFKWVVDKSYAIHQNFNPRQTNWPAIYARHHLYNRGGDCHADGAAFAYLAAAIGYKADVCIDSWGTGRAPSHCWAMIGNKVYDPLFYESKSTMYYGATSGTYETNPTARFRVPQYNPKNAKEGAKASAKLIRSGYSGLKKVGSSYYFYSKGEAVTSTWKTVAGKRYYFKDDGRAATLSTKIGGVYYVFDKNGVLQNSAKAGKRLVKIGSQVYQVSKSGKAVAGWSADKTKRFDKTGLLLVGTRVVDGKFYAASSEGVYSKSETAALNAAAKRNRPAVALYRLLGKPQTLAYSSNCEGKGYDGLWMYENFIVTTIRPKGVKAIDKVAASTKAGTTPAAPYEYVCTIEAQ